VRVRGGHDGCASGVLAWDHGLLDSERCLPRPHCIGVSTRRSPTAAKSRDKSAPTARSSPNCNIAPGVVPHDVALPEGVVDRPVSRHFATGEVAWFKILTPFISQIATFSVLSGRRMSLLPSPLKLGSAPFTGLGGDGSFQVRAGLNRRNRLEPHKNDPRLCRPVSVDAARVPVEAARPLDCVYPFHFRRRRWVRRRPKKSIAKPPTRPLAWAQRLPPRPPASAALNLPRPGRGQPQLAKWVLLIEPMLLRGSAKDTICRNQQSKRSSN
jgi:hypothetical protein